jgi:hypothetical protein
MERRQRRRSFDRPPPKIPDEKPATAQERNVFLKQAARWLANAIRTGGPWKAFVATYQALSWLDTDAPLVNAYLDPPKTLQELQQAASTSKAGYDIHHIVEQASAAEDGFPPPMIDAPENKVSIPKMKHWEITGWYAKKNEDFGNLSPRDFLRGKSWDERLQVGLDALIKHGVRKP